MLSNSQEGLTALILAVKQSHTKVVKELVYHGSADVNIFEKVFPIHCHSSMNSFYVCRKASWWLANYSQCIINMLCCFASILSVSSFTTNISNFNRMIMLVAMYFSPYCAVHPMDCFILCCQRWKPGYDQAVDPGWCEYMP